MAVLPKNVPRFLPTLTEVVQPRVGLPRSPANDGMSKPPLAITSCSTGYDN